MAHQWTSLGPVADRWGDHLRIESTSRWRWLCLRPVGSATWFATGISQDVGHSNWKRYLLQRPTIATGIRWNDVGHWRLSQLRRWVELWHRRRQCFWSTDESVLSALQRHASVTLVSDADCHEWWETVGNGRSRQQEEAGTDPRTIWPSHRPQRKPSVPEDGVIHELSWHPMANYWSCPTANEKVTT